MKKNFGKKTFLYPMPVLIIATYDKDGNPNAMNAAWGGIHDTNQIAICISPEHKTAKNLLETKAFTINIADVNHICECDYLGIVSGNEILEKLKNCNFSVSKSEFVNAPIINELPMALECELVSFDEKTGCTVANIINVCAEEDVLTDGKIDVKKVNPITYDPVAHHYYSLGDLVGQAFSDGKKIKQ